MASGFGENLKGINNSPVLQGGEHWFGVCFLRFIWGVLGF